MSLDGVLEARALVANALTVSVERIKLETKLYDDRAWDSFGQLIVILAIEETLNIQITDEATFETLTSVIGIAKYLANAHIYPPSNP